MLEWLREQRPDLASRVVVVTGGVISDAAERFLATAAVELVRKPMDPEQLLERVRAVARSTPGAGTR